MSKKLTSTICGCTMMICGGICLVGYVMGNSGFPWWLLVFAGGIGCAIISMIGGITREKDQEKRSKKFISCICASISMLSVLIFLTLLMLTKLKNTWLIVVVGGIASGVTRLIYDAIKNKK